MILPNICKKIQILLPQADKMMTLEDNSFKNENCNILKMCNILGTLIIQRPTQCLSRNNVNSTNKTNLNEINLITTLK